MALAATVVVVMIERIFRHVSHAGNTVTTA